MWAEFENQIKEADGHIGFNIAMLDIKEFSNLQIESRAEYLSPWIKAGSIGMISGWRGCGKTWFALGILDAVTRGISFGPWNCDDPVPCGLLDGEMVVSDIMERANDFNLNCDRPQPLYVYSDAYATQQGLSRANLTDQAWRADMKALLLHKQIKFWVIDNLASLASGLDENIRKDWDPINQWLLELRFAGISTLMLHHLGKTGFQRGTSAREDNLDYSIVLKPPHNYTPEDGCRFIVNFSKARVRTSELPRIADTEFKLLQNDAGNLVWTWSAVKAEIRNQVLTLVDQGIEGKTVAEALGISKGRVSQIKSQAVKDGLLTAKGKLTQSGFAKISTQN